MLKVKYLLFCFNTKHSQRYYRDRQLPKIWLWILKKFGMTSFSIWVYLQPLVPKQWVLLGGFKLRPSSLKLVFYPKCFLPIIRIFFRVKRFIQVIRIFLGLNDIRMANTTFTWSTNAISTNWSKDFCSNNNNNNNFFF